MLKFRRTAVPCRRVNKCHQTMLLRSDVMTQLQKHSESLINKFHVKDIEDLIEDLICGQTFLDNMYVCQKCARILV